MSKQKKYSIDKKSLWGIDLGGTKIEGVILHSPKDAEVMFRERIPTEAEQGYEHVLEQVKKLVNMMVKEAGFKPTTIGFGTPGSLDPKLGVMKNSNSTILNGKPLKQDLETQLGIPVVIANDANCFVLAETRL